MAAWRRRMSGALRGFARQRAGATALEFALIATPLIFMIFTIIELALILVMSISLEDAASNMARKIRVGTYVAPGDSVVSSTGSQLDLADFKSDLCGYIYLVPASLCQSQVQVDIRPFTSFSGVTLPSPISGGTFSNSGLCYYSGTEGSIVLMRVYYLWPVIAPFWLGGLDSVQTYSSGGSSTNGQWAAITANEVFVNEPVGTIVNTSNSC